MKCPKCNVTLAIADRQGIEIDYCPECRGVWLDRGELDKIIERSSDFLPEKKKKKDFDRDPYFNSEYDRRNEQSSFGGGYSRHDDRHKPHKKKSILGELFDFD